MKTKFSKATFATDQTLDMNTKWPLHFGLWRQRMDKGTGRPASLLLWEAPETSSSEWLRGDLRAVDPPADPQVMVSHFHAYLHLILSCDACLRSTSGN